MRLENRLVSPLGSQSELLLKHKQLVSKKKWCVMVREGGLDSKFETLPELCITAHDTKTNRGYSLQIVFMRSPS